MNLRKLVICCLLLLGTYALNAQSFVKGNKVLNFSVGLGSTLYTGSGYSSAVPPVSFSFEKGIVDGIAGKGAIGVGGYLGYTSAKWLWSGQSYGWKYSSIIVGGRGAFHFPLINKFDTYGGVMLGYNIVTAKETGTWPGTTTTAASASEFTWSLFAGGRYYFTPNFAGLVELGYGIAYLNLGIAIKL